MTFLVCSAIGFVLLTALMVVLHKRKVTQAAYIPCCLASAACGTNLIMAGYGHFVGVFNLYFYILVTLVLGLIIDLIIRKTVTQYE